MLLARGALVDTQDQDQNTILHIAALKGYQDLVKMLLSLGANRSIRNNQDQLPSHVANNEDIRLLLSEYNEQEGSKQKRLLMRALSAVREGNDEVAGILLSQGLDVDESGTKTQQDLLHQAASKGVPEVVKIQSITTKM